MFANQTIWIYQRGKHDWRAVDVNGVELATGKFGSTLEHTMRKRITDEGLDYTSVAMVVNPANRQPHRRIVITRPMRAAGVLTYAERAKRMK
jgi:hypothetical protein